MQNDVMAEGGAFAESGSPQHAREQNVVENIRRLAEVCRARGVMVMHVHFLVERGSPGLTLNAPLFESLADANSLVRGPERFAFHRYRQIGIGFRMFSGTLLDRFDRRGAA